MQKKNTFNLDTEKLYNQYKPKTIEDVQEILKSQTKDLIEKILQFKLSVFFILKQKIKTWVSELIKIKRRITLWNREIRLFIFLIYYV
ncbi:hypothetical protein RRG61_04310 [Mycoplasmopsis felis]|nr:hypothetical protein [Mycoplasmopsis felis]WQQ07878.1 hypothetical protein RRG57_00735 [Mycoplasmopsis felis]